jgi:hypothetical protein
LAQNEKLGCTAVKREEEARPACADGVAHHDEMAAPSKPAQKTARAVEGPRPGAAGNQARVHGERRRGAELDRYL